MANRVVFLDFDGVICTSKTYKKAPNWSEQPDKLIDPDLVANVQTLCELSGASVVISSAWRTMNTLEQLQTWLREAGLNAPVIGATPNLLATHNRSTRGHKIAEWVLNHNLDAGDFVILEDIEDVRPFRGRQVQTTFEGTRPGFTKRHLRVALGLFGIKLDKKPKEQS